jgi:hypothetical protein
MLVFQRYPTLGLVYRNRKQDVELPLVCMEQDVVSNVVLACCNNVALASRIHLRVLRQFSLLRH